MVTVMNFKVEIYSQSDVVHVAFETLEQAQKFFKSLGVNNGDSDRCLATLYDVEDSNTLDQKPVLELRSLDKALQSGFPWVEVELHTGKILRGSRVIPKDIHIRFSDM